jgi:hypothetical protein
VLVRSAWESNYPPKLLDVFTEPYPLVSYQNNSATLTFYDTRKIEGIENDDPAPLIPSIGILWLLFDSSVPLSSFEPQLRQWQVGN